MADLRQFRIALVTHRALNAQPSSTTVREWAERAGVGLYQLPQPIDSIGVADDLAWDVAGDDRASLGIIFEEIRRYTDSDYRFVGLIWERHENPAWIATIRHHARQAGFPLARRSRLSENDTESVFARPLGGRP